MPESSIRNRLSLESTCVSDPSAAPPSPRRADADTLPVLDRETPCPRIAGFEVLGELGRGSMGVVYRARQLSLNRLVALKMVRTGARAGPEDLNRFLDEARLVARLQHPNIVQIHEVSAQGDNPFFCMELVEGGNLAERLGGKPQPFRLAARLVLTLARAIHVAHEQGIVHRDLKPANVLLAEPQGPASHVRKILGDATLWPPDALPWTPKITDFGLAKQIGESGGQTHSGMVLGTPSYMAPEQAEGKSREVGPAADVYSLGAILYELLTGRPPYNAESPMETVLLLCQTEPVAPSRLQPKLPRNLETVCLKCLQKEPRRRYPSAQELADDLERFLAGEPVTARPASLGERAWKWVRRRPARATLAASALMTVAALVGLAAWHQMDLGTRLTRARQEQRLAGVRDEIKDLVREAEAALGQQNWRRAQFVLARSRDRAGADPGLGELRARIDQLLERAGRQRADRERFQTFLRRRGDALFNATLFTGGDLVSTLQETRAAAREALALYGVTPDSDTAPAVESPYLTAAEKDEVVTGCYELLLVLAEAEAQPLPGEPADQRQRRAREALHTLDSTARLGIVTQAYHFRRAHYLERAGEEDGARRERALAEGMSPATALDQFLLGDDHYRQGDWKGAASAFETALQRQPDHFWAQYYLALCRLKTRRPDLAAAGLTSCLALRPDFPWLHLLRGSACGELGQFANAEADFEAALKGRLTETARYALLVNRGVLRVRQGQAAEAVDDLRAAIALRPRQYQGHVNLAQAYLKMQKPDDAVRELDVAVGCEPGLAALYRTRARVLLLRRDTAAALDDLDRAVELDTPSRSPALADDHLERARLLRRRKDHAGAVRACDAALELRPRDVRAHRLRAKALLGCNRLDEALTSLDACLKHGPPDADAFRARAAVRARLGQYPGAQTDYTRALELHPDAATYAARGWTYLVTDAPKLALPDFNQAIRLEPSLGDAYNGRGLARALLGRHREAAADAEEALRRGPASSRLLYGAARTYARAAAAGAEGGGRQTWALCARYEERALQLLGGALELLPRRQRAAFWQKSVRADPMLDSIRGRFEFRQLAATYSR